LGKLEALSCLRAPLAMYFVVSELPNSRTSGVSPPAIVASNFVRWSPQVWYCTLTSTPGCFALNAAFASATTFGQPLCASPISQTVMLSALAVPTDPLAVDAAAESATASTAASMIRAFISPPEGVGAPGRSLHRAPSGLVHRPRRGDWHSPLALSRPHFS